MAGAALTAIQFKHFSTTGGAGNSDTLTLSNATQAVWVSNNDASVDLYARLDGTAPVIAADETIRIPPKTSKKISFGVTGGGTVVKVISASAISVDVEAVG